jgi:hypothetical protein
MTAPPVAWPPGRHVLGWWGEVADLRPRRLWLRHLQLHHVEALVVATRPCRILPLPAALLHMLELAQASPDELAGRLHFDPAVVRQLLRGLADEGLVECTAGRCALTPAGRQAQHEGTVPSATRRAFHFLDRSDCELPPHFVPLDDSRAAPLPPPPGWQFDPGLLRECAHRPGPWKACFRFPADVRDVLLGGAGAADGTPEWQGVVLDRPEHLHALFLELAAAEKASSATRLIAYSVAPQDWSLRRDRTVLELREAWAEVFPDLAAGPPPEAWRQAWRAWCQPRGVPPADAEACRLEPARVLLRVHAPRKLVDRLRAARSDAVKNEAWLQAGTGPARALARIELHAQG